MTHTHTRSHLRHLTRLENAWTVSFYTCTLSHAGTLGLGKSGEDGKN